MRAVAQEMALVDVACEMICDLLEKHSQRLEMASNHQPGNPGEGTTKAAKRPRSVPWPNPSLDSEGGGHAPDLPARILGGSAAATAQSLQPETMVRHVEQPPLSGSGPHVLAPACSAEDAPAKSMTLCSCPEANTSGLAQARHRTRKPTVEVQLRRNKLVAHLVKVAADGQPISVRTLYDTYRETHNTNAEEMCSAKLRTALEGVCNDVAGVEYLILKQQHEAAVLRFIPTDKKRPQNAQSWAGKAPVGDKILHFYRSSVPRGYASAISRRNLKRHREPQETGALSGYESGNENETQEPVALSANGNETQELGHTGIDEGGHALNGHEIRDLNKNEIQEPSPHIGEGHALNGHECYSFDSEPFQDSEQRVSTYIFESPENSNDSTGSLYRKIFGESDRRMGRQFVCQVTNNKSLGLGGGLEEVDCRGEDDDSCNMCDGKAKGVNCNGTGYRDDGAGGGDGHPVAMDGQVLLLSGEAEDGSGHGGDGASSGDEGDGAGSGDGGDGAGAGDGGHNCSMRLDILAQAAENAAAEVPHRPRVLACRRRRPLAHASPGAPCCSFCHNESEFNLRTCPGCKSFMCHTCAGISTDLLSAIRPFLSEAPCKAWEELQCLACQSVQHVDSSLADCMADIHKAIASSLKLTGRKNKPDCERLWYHVGLLFAVGGPFMGAFFSDTDRQLLENMLRHEVKSKTQPSIGPWEAEMLGLPPDLILSVSRFYADKFKLKASPGALNDTDTGKRRILYVSADIGEHPTGHLMSGELMEMERSQRAEVFLLCVAKEDRLKDLKSSSSRCRTALKQAYGARFLELGLMDDQSITQEINKLSPSIIYLAGFHQDGDRIGVLKGVTGAVIVQAVAHASTTGSRGVHFLLCNEQVLPPEMQRHYTEQLLYIDGPFLPNSFKTGFGDDDKLLALRNDKETRSKARAARGMPIDAVIIANIAKPDRLEKRFFDMALVILKANADAFLLLIDHGYPAFRRRMEARFEERGLQGRILFMPFQDLQTGELHRFLALIDVYLDSPVYNSHTAGQDALWANGVLVTVRGDRLASRVAADLLHWFGTPENICDNSAAAVARVNELLQDPRRLSEARSKADKCRDSSTMYDNARRADMVIDALLRSFEDTVRIQQQKKNKKACSSSTQASKELADEDFVTITSLMEGLGIDHNGSAERNAQYVMLPARFRNVQVVVKITRELDVPDRDNPTFREVLARNGRFHEFGTQLFTQLLPLDENLIIGEDEELDVIQFTIRGRKAYAIIEEPQGASAGALLDGLANEWRAKPAQDTVKRTACFLLGGVKVLQCLHARGKAYGGDPRDWKLSLLKDGYGRTAPAYVQYDGAVYSLLLGDAERLIDPSLPTNERSNTEQRRRLGTARSVQVLACNATVASSRQSLRKVVSDASIPASRIAAMLFNSESASHSHPIIATSQRSDLRNAGMAVLNAILGGEGQETVVAGKQRTACDLFRCWLDTLSEDEFRNATGVRARNDVDDALCRSLMGKTLQLNALFELLEILLGDALVDARLVLEGNPFPGMDVPVHAYPDGLESAPEVVRHELRACPKLMKRIQEKVLHVYVAGRTVEWYQQQKRLIPTWLVFNWDDKKKKYNRSLWTAADGDAEDLAAIYLTRREDDEAIAKFLSSIHLMKFPTCKICLDGKPRALDDTHKAVAAGEVGQYANSSRNEIGSLYRTANCSREWNSNWKSLDLPGHDVALGLKLLMKVKPYEEIHYEYYWGKYQKNTDHVRALTNGV